MGLLPQLIVGVNKLNSELVAERPRGRDLVIFSPAVRLELLIRDHIAGVSEHTHKHC